MKYAIAPVDPKIALSDSKADQLKLMQSVKEMLASANITTKNVVVGLPSARVFTTVVDIERLPLNELAKTIKYQADALIPTPVAESKIDWAVIGDSPQPKSTTGSKTVSACRMKRDSFTCPLT